MITRIVVLDISYTSFSLKETMIKLNQPFIEWSDGLLGTQYSPVDRQHKWLLTMINVLIHICSNNVLQINLIDVLEALYDYTCIHFAEEEMIFMDVIYPFLFQMPIDS